MTDHLFVAPRRIVCEHGLEAYPPETQHRFRGDPAHWLPGRLTMHGGSTFHTSTRFLGVRTELQFVIGPSWMRGDAITRSMRISCIEPPVGMAWLLPVVEGELTAFGVPHPRLRFEGRSMVAGIVGIREWSARNLTRMTVDGIADRLAIHAPPTPPSRAAPDR